MTRQIVTVAGPERATATSTIGPDGPAWTARLVERGYKALIILADGTVHTAPGVPLARHSEKTVG